MPVIATDLSQRLSNWLKYEYDPSSGVTREVLSRATVIAGGALYSGSVLDSAGALVVTATVADATYILIDDLSRPSADQFTGALVLARGYAKVADKALIFGAGVSDANKLVAMNALKAKNIFAVEQL